MLLSYDIEEVELDTLAPSLTAIRNARTQCENGPHSCLLRNTKDVIGFLKQTLRTKRLEMPSPGHEKGAWVADHFKLLVLLGHRYRIWRDAALRELTDMVAFNKSLDTQDCVST